MLEQARLLQELDKNQAFRLWREGVYKALDDLELATMNSAPLETKEQKDSVINDIRLHRKMKFFLRGMFVASDNIAMRILKRVNKNA